MSGLFGKFNEGIDQLYGQPAFRLGLGLLGRRNQDLGQALTGSFTDYGQWQQANQQYQMQQAEEERRQQLLAQQQQQQMAAQQQAAAQQAWMRENMPHLVNAPAAYQKQAFEAAFADPASPKTTGGMQYIDGQWKPIPGWLEQQKAARAAGAARNVFAPTINPLRPNVEGNLQGKVIAGKQSLKQIDRLLNDLRAAPDMVGRPQKMLESLGSEARAWGKAFGLDALKSAGELISPKTDVVDADGNVRTVTPTTIATQTLAVKSAVLPLLKPDEGPLNKPEQESLDEALGYLNSADSQVRIQAMETIVAVTTPKLNKIMEYLRASGAAVPGEAQQTRVGTKQEYDALPSGSRYIAPDGSVRVKK